MNKKKRRSHLTLSLHKRACICRVRDFLVLKYLGEKTFLFLIYIY